MKKFTLFLFSMFIAVTAMAQTVTIEPSTSVETPEHIYTIKSGAGYYMTSYTSPTALQPGRFAFYATGDEGAFKVYSIDRKVWVSYTKAASYSEGANFATLVETQEGAEAWNMKIVENGGVAYYQIAPYNTTTFASKYWNWYGNLGTNPYDNTNKTIGLYSKGVAGDAGSRWIIENATELATEADINAAKELIKTTVGYPKTTTAAYKAMEALSYGTTTTKNLELALNAYYRESDIILPENGKAYTLANFAYNGTRYMVYNNGQKISLSTDANTASVFVCKQISNGVYAFVTEDGKILTWVGNNETGAYKENNNIYGYSSYYATLYNTKSDWNNITIKKNGTATKDLGHVRMVARRNSGAVSSFIVKGSENRFDQAGDGYWLDESNNYFSSAWILTEVEHTASAAQETALAKIDFKLKGYILGENIGEYALVANDEKHYDFGVVDAAETVADVNAITVQLNMPERGKYYRFKGHGTDNYMLSDVHTDAKYLAMGSGELASAIFYYGEDGSLLSYANGRYLSDAAQSSSDWTCLAVGTVGSAATFAAGKTIGEYGFYVGDDASRAYYSGRKTYVDAGGSIAANDGYDWIIEEVTTLPVTVTEAGYATFFAPVEVTVPEGTVTAHTVTVDGEWASLSEALTTIPAKTGVVLANAGTVELAINYAGEAETIAENVLKGTAAKAIITKESGSYYILAMPEGAEAAGFYAPVKGDDANTFINGSHKAYMHLAAQGAAYYSFRFPGTTGVEEITEYRVQSTVIYDLTGRRVEAITAPGIYIVNGKKVLVK